MTARDRSRPAALMPIVWAMAALSIGCAHVPTNSTAPGMFSLPEAIDDRFDGRTGPEVTTGSPQTSEETDRHGVEISENLRRGRQEAEAGRPDQAVRFYERVVRDDPQNAEAHHRLAVLADRAGDYFAAERSYLAALDAGPDDPDVLNDLGYSYLLQQRYAECEQALRQATRLDPSHARALSNLSLLYSTIGDRQRATAVLRSTPSRTRPRATPTVPIGLQSPIVLTAGTAPKSLPLWTPPVPLNSNR
ncbi:MAG: tetratricopeptide repeat protein [Planctomycetaceae bacterium]